MPKIVIFRGKAPSSSFQSEPYRRLAGSKYSTYVELFEEIAKSSELYVVFGYENYLGSLGFRNAQRYLGAGFFKTEGEELTADAVYDRSYQLEFPKDNEPENKKVMNCLTFKEFSRNKLALAEKYPEYCPQTKIINSRDELKKNLPGHMMVYKPITGMKGKGIEFITDEGDLLGKNFAFPGILQDFKETKEGVPGLLKGRHDMRVVVVNGQVVWATVRQPKADGLLANVAQGGSIKEIDPEKIPQTALDIVMKLAKDFAQEYYNPLFSVDLGFEEGEPFIYEINDQIGFPLPEMRWNRFTLELAGDLARRARL